MVTITARQRVLSFLGRRNAASAAQIGRALNLSAATVRHHLSILLADGRIVLAGVETRAKRGRPEKTYRLSDKLLGESLDTLADAMLVTWLDALPAPERDEAVQALAERMVERIGKIDSDLAPAKRLVQLTEKLDSLHYQARWEAGAQGPRMLFGHCPYAAIIAKHPELCKMDAAILGTQLNARMEQLAKIDPSLAAGTHCIFAVREQRPPRNKSD